MKPADAVAHPLHILQVEDNMDDALLLQRVLRTAAGAGLRLTHTTRLDDALHRLDRERVDAVLLDLGLPDSAGMDTLRRVRAQAPAVPVVILTGHDDTACAEWAVQLGAQDCLVKGRVDGEGVVRVLRYAVERQAMLVRLERAHRHEHHLSHYDPLTQLPNRHSFRDQLGRALAQARRQVSRVAVLFLDLDRFKFINDTLGHAVGDQVLRAVAARLQTTIREDDIPARLGGDEFTVIVSGLDDGFAVGPLAQRIVDGFRRSFAVEGNDLYLTPSLGVSVFPSDGADADALLRCADLAMYRAKEAGGNTFRFYAPAMNARAAQRLEREHGLRRALERREFALHYQCQVDAATGDLTGAEALVRWQHPSLGLLPPAEFIPVAEETGLIVPLGEWVLHTACAQAAAWREAGAALPTIAVNLSARQFRQEGLTESVAAALDAAGLPPEALRLEITESCAMQDADASRAALEELQGLGVQLAVDDFGTGYSSLAHLRRLPFDALKVDRSFVHDLPADRDAAAITEAIVALGHTLGMRVVAEGVETPDQIACLRALGSDEMQGYAFSLPLPAPVFAERLADGAWRSAARHLTAAAPA